MKFPHLIGWKEEILLFSHLLRAVHQHQLNGGSTWQIELGVILLALDLHAMAILQHVLFTL